MTKQLHWQATITEQRTAWAVAGGCMIVVLLAAIQPQWFEFPVAPQETKTLHESNSSPAAEHLRPSLSRAQLNNDKENNPSQTTKQSITGQITNEKTTTEQTTTKQAATEQRAIVTITPTSAVKPISKSKPTENTRPAAKKSAAPEAGFYIQLGAFQQRPAAQGLAEKLRKKGWNTHVTAKNNGLHAVWIGPQTSRSEAARQLKSIQLKSQQQGFIVHQKNTSP